MLFPLLIALVWIWIAFSLLSFRYLKSLFADLRFGWTPANQLACLTLCLAGPAAMICGLAVDFSRPL
jgi:hypothetical protein